MSVSSLGGVLKAADRDALRPLDTPVFVAGTTEPPAEREPVIVVRGVSEIRAYPERILIWRGVVNDLLDGEPIAVTFDPLAGTARVFSRQVDGRTLTFGTSGLVRGGNALLFDRETESLWQQMSGAAIAGPLAASSLRTLPAVVGPWLEFTHWHPDGRVLSAKAAQLEDRHAGADYNRNPYLGYDSPRGKPILTLAPPDDRLPAMKRVTVVETANGPVAIALPLEGTKDDAAFVIDTGGGRTAYLFDWKTAAVLDTRIAGNSRSVGSLTAFEPSASGEPLTFVAEGDRHDRLLDEQSRTRWNVLGDAVEGPHKDAVLQPLPQFTGFWFAVASIYPGIELMTSGQ